MAVKVPKGVRTPLWIHLLEGKGDAAVVLQWLLLALDGPELSFSHLRLASHLLYPGLELNSGSKLSSTSMILGKASSCTNMSRLGYARRIIFNKTEFWREPVFLTPKNGFSEDII